MGAIDTEGKQYLSNSLFFADAFNYLLYDGDQVIKPEEMRELDTTELTVPYGSNSRVPVQKYRDLLKMWNAVMDDNAIYVILGAELQDKVHYGMPVKDGLYDMLGYSRQIAEIKRSYQKKSEETNESADDEAELTVDDGVLKIRLTSAEFLSGLRKGDKLNLFSRADMGEDEFDKFHTGLGFAMRVIMHQSEDADAIIMATNHKKIDRETAEFLNRAVNLNLVHEENTGGIDMCKALERRYQEKEVTGAIQGMRKPGANDDTIIKAVMGMFSVTREYVIALLKAQVA